jgi:deazaflavin-dependent oxidoreductase (nitroreductase family)
MRGLLDFLSPIPFPAWFMRVMGRLNAASLRLVRGRGPLTSNALILTTRGRRSGRERSTVLLYFDIGEKRYVVASFAGMDRQPAWYLNALADAHVTYEVRGELTRCIARAVPQEEAAALWPSLNKMYPGFRRYRNRTTRLLPVVELGPDQAAAAVGT